MSEKLNLKTPVTYYGGHLLGEANQRRRGTKRHKS
jgi:hypothetical protein